MADSDFERQAGMASGAVRVKVLKPGERLDVPDVPAGASVALAPTEGGDTVAAGAAQNPGIWNVVLKMADAIRPASGVSVITLVPLSAKKSGRIGNYSIGSWPYEATSADAAAEAASSVRSSSHSRARRPRWRRQGAGKASVQR